MRTFFVLVGLVMAAQLATAETIRIASFNASLSRSGPGLLLRDLDRGEDPQIDAVVGILQTVRPDILLLNEFDYDGSQLALNRFADILATGESGLRLAHRFSAPVNTGVPSGMDLNGDGSTSGPADSFGYGRFPGQYGMAILARFPIRADDVATFRLLRWAEFPDALQPLDGAAPIPSEPEWQRLRLSSKSHWDVPVEVPGGVLHLLASHPTPPVFDGPEDFNGKRNHDEIAFWRQYIDGTVFPDDTGVPRRAPDAPFVVLGDLNADPVDGDGRHEGILSLLTHPRLQDPAPQSAGAAEAARIQAGANRLHDGPASQDTADWNDTRGPGNLRVDYVLPSVDLTVLDAGVFWPAQGTPGAEWIGTGKRVSSDHRLVWVDVTLP
ncbi:MAG: endonuclease/exonuclease/phosphatase family protein [Pseudomonadota bacterium]